MLERFAALEADADDAKSTDMVHPFLEVGGGRMWDRIVVLVAVMAIEVALLRHIEVCDPGLAVENPKGVLQRAHCSSIAFLNTASSNQASAGTSDATLSMR